MLNESTSNEKKFVISVLDMPKSNNENGLGKVAAIEKDLSSNPLAVQPAKLGRMRLFSLDLQTEMAGY